MCVGGTHNEGQESPLLCPRLQAEASQSTQILDLAPNFFSYAFCDKAPEFLKKKKKNMSFKKHV